MKALRRKKENQREKTKRKAKLKSKMINNKLNKTDKESSNFNHIVKMLKNSVKMIYSHI